MYTLATLPQIKTQQWQITPIQSATPRTPKDTNDRVRLMHNFLCLHPCSFHIHDHFQDRTSVSPETADLKITSDTFYNKIVGRIQDQTAQ